MKNSRYILLLAMAICAMSCSKETGPAGSMKGSIIQVRKLGVTKSSAITTESLRESAGFTMEAYVQAYTDFRVEPHVNYDPWNSAQKYYFRTDVEFSSTQWRLLTEQNWVANVPTSFWCYAPMTVNGTRALNYPASVNARTRTFTYEMPHGTVEDMGTPEESDDVYKDADAADDIIFAYKEQTFNGTNEFVDLKFYHALAQLCFCVSPDDSKFDKRLTIKSIEIRNIPVSGTCTINGEGDMDDMFTWSALGSADGSVRQTFGSTFTSAPKKWEVGSYTSGVNKYTLYTSTNNFFIIPHQMNGNEHGGTHLRIVFIDNGVEYTVDKAINELLKPGYYYKYKIDATVIGRTIDLGVSLVDWEEFDDKLILES